jgi:hypothetical protein
MALLRVAPDTGSKDYYEWVDSRELALLMPRIIVGGLQAAERGSAEPAANKCCPCRGRSRPAARHSLQPDPARPPADLSHEPIPSRN